MKIKVKYFGAIAEVVNLETEMMDVEGENLDLAHLKSQCLAQYPMLKRLDFQLAVNQKLASSGTLNDGDEVAFLPPFAGG